jgi:hypothetical protein
MRIRDILALLGVSIFFGLLLSLDMNIFYAIGIPLILFIFALSALNYLNNGKFSVFPLFAVCGFGCLFFFCAGMEEGAIICIVSALIATAMFLMLRYLDHGKVV